MPDRDQLARDVLDNPKLRELVVEERRGSSWSPLLTVDVLDADERAALDVDAPASSPSLVDDVWRVIEEQAALEGPTRFRVQGWGVPRARRPMFERTFVVGTPTLGETKREAESAVASVLVTQSNTVEKLSRMLERSYAGREAACTSRELATSKLGNVVEQILDAVSKAASGLFAGASGDVALKQLEAAVKAEDNRHAEAQREADSNDDMMMQLLTMFAQTVTAGASPTPPQPSGATSTQRCRESRDLAKVVSNATAKHDQIRELLGDDPWRLIVEASNAPDVQTFDALFGRFYEHLHSKGKEGATQLVAELSPLLGFDMLVLMRLSQGFEERHRR